MADSNRERLRAFVFKNRGLLLAVPALVLVASGKPSAFSIAVGLPIAIAGELLRCWAVGYSGVTTRHDVVTAPKLVTAGPYAHVRNPLYVGNFITAAGFAIAFTGANTPAARGALVGGCLAAMTAVYAAIVPHEEGFLRAEFGDDFERYRAQVPPVLPRITPLADGQGAWQFEAVKKAESHTLLVFGATLAALALRARA